MGNINREITGKVYRYDFENVGQNQYDEDLFKLNLEVEYFLSDKRFVQSVLDDINLSKPAYTDAEVEKIIQKYPLGKEIRVQHQPNDRYQPAIVA